MLVKCLNNDIRKVNPNTEFGREITKWFGYNSYIMPLTVGKIYVVYALAITKRWTCYFVANDDYTSYPMGYFASFFKIVDKRVSQCWIVGQGEIEAESTNMILSFDEWMSEDKFQERLLDGYDREKQIFQDRKEFMDLEFPNPSIVDAAEAFKDDWLYCPKCLEGWQSKAIGGLVRCPKGNELLNNPRYVKDS